MPAAVATALASAAKPVPELAAEVVAQALQRTGADIARSVLLFLSSDFSRVVPQAVLAASRAGHCLQVAGCTAAGLLTEADWVLDRPAACAMVFAGDAVLGPADPAEGPCLSLAVPQAATPDWVDAGGRRFGLISSDGVGHDPGHVWAHGKPLSEGRCEAGWRGARVAVAVSRGIRVLSPILEVTAADGYDLARIGNRPALDTLARELPLELRRMERPPYHLLFAGVISGAPDRALEQGRYVLVPIIAGNTDERSVTLGAPIEPGARVFWCMRQAIAAERDTRAALESARHELGGTPDFALMFSCMGRGPYFFGGPERDLELTRSRFPGTPIIGAYGAGEIAPLPLGNRVIYNSAVIALAKESPADVQSDA
jgi:small ligand-binding sensory domain FIST